MYRCQVAHQGATEELIKGDQGHTVLFYHCTEETLADVGVHPGSGSDNFEKSPPNANLAVVSEDGAEDVVVTLTNPRLDGDTLRYDVTVIEGPANVQGGPCSLFVDLIGMPLTHMSVVGVDRRVTRRTPWIRTAVKFTSSRTQVYDERARRAT